MLEKIKNKIDVALHDYIRTLDTRHGLKCISPILFNNLKNFALRDGKRIRPALFVIGYLGFAKKQALNLYTSAVSIELLHDFMLVHDDIIDKSSMRRGKPSLHTLFNTFLKKKQNVKFSGEDLAIVAGDVLYAMAIHAFLSIREEPKRKENALKKLVEAALYTGSGEFIELIYGIKSIETLSQRDIYRVYDLKTANYTFSAPLTIGAILAGAGRKEIDILTEYGINVGRAFQIKDDILGMFGKEESIGKSILTDLRESKKTLLVWKAFHMSTPKDKATIKLILEKNNAKMPDLLAVRNIVTRSGAYEYAKNQINRFSLKAQSILSRSKIAPAYKETIDTYARKILTV